MSGARLRRAKATKHVDERNRENGTETFVNSASSSRVSNLLPSLFFRHRVAVRLSVYADAGARVCIYTYI